MTRKTVTLLLASTLSVSRLLIAQPILGPTLRREALRLMLPAGDFESGTLDGWRAEGAAFANQPIEGNTIAARRPGETPNQHGRYWIGSYERAMSDAPQGTLRSPDFTISRSFIRFRIGGGTLARNVGVELRTDDPDTPLIYRAAGRDAEGMSVVTWDVRSYSGMRAYILVYDRSSGPWGHINVDHFEFVNEPPPPEVFRSWDFDDYRRTDWDLTGTAFDSQPTFGENISSERVVRVPLGGDYWKGPYPIGQQGRYWIGTFENRPLPSDPWGRTQGDVPQGTMTSQEFVIGKPYVTLLVGGGNRDEERVELQVRMDPRGAMFYALPRVRGAIVRDGEFVAARIAHGRNSEVLSRVDWNVRGFIGYTARIRIVDHSPEPWGHINVDDIRFADQLAAPPPAELWGFADTHAHPVADRGFGGLYWGDHAGPLETALPWCTPAHGIGGTGARDAGGALALAGQALLLMTAPLQMAVSGRIALNQEAIRDVAINAVEGSPGHLVGGYPQFDGWPRFNTKTHQHMHEEWVRRAYDGGLRLMVALAVNAEMLANIRPLPGVARSDVAAYDAQIASIREMARRNSSWMEIAESPAQARAIIANNKLALVLGIEVDTLGGFRTEADVRAGLERELARIERLGVRHIFPIHLANNPLGGYALYSDVFVFNNYVLRQRFPVITSDPSVDYRPLEGLPAPEDPVWNQLQQMLQSANLTLLHLTDFDVNLEAMTTDLRTVLRSSATHSGGQANALGLTATGRWALDRMMSRGMIVEVDHMSKAAAEETLAIAASRTANGITGYPVTSGHTTFRELRWQRDRDVSDRHKFAHEADKTVSQIERLRALHGMVAPMTTLFDFRGWSRRVANDSPGSTKTFAQSYLYAVEKMQGRGVALSTDMALLGGLGPRFGPWSAFAAHGDPAVAARERASSENEVRSRSAAVQSAGVRYDTPIRDVRGSRFDAPGDAIAGASNLWVAVLLGASDVDIDSADLGGIRTIGEVDWIRDVATGVRAAVRGQPLESLPDTSIWNYNPRGVYNRGVVQRGGWHGYNLSDALLVVGRPLAIQDANIREVAAQLYGVAGAIRAMNGPNPPLRRYRMGIHDADFNLDGLAHYGLLPDMLQDLKNTGLTFDDLVPLFRSAEDYIAMWERCERMRTVH